MSDRTRLPAPGGRPTEDGRDGARGRLRAAEAADPAATGVLGAPRGDMPPLPAPAWDALRGWGGARDRLIQRMPAVVFELAADGRTLFASDAVERVTGYHPTYLLGRNWWQTLCPGERSARAADLAGRLCAGDVDGYEMVWRGSSGAPVAVEITSANRYLPGGALEGIVGCAVDVSARKRAQESCSRLAATVEAMPYLVATAGPDGRLSTLNDAGRRMLGIGDGEDVGRLSLSDIHPPWARETLSGQAIPGATAAGVWQGETALVSTGGKEVPVFEVILAHRPPGCDDEFLSVIAIDTSERARLEGELRQAQKMEAIGRLAGGVAHDFNNLLVPMLGYSEILEASLPSDSPLRRYATEMTKTAKRAACLPRQLMAFSRRQVLQPTVLDLNAVVTGIEAMLRRLIGEDINLLTTLDPALGRVRADLGSIEQIIMNLAVNARDAMPTGGKLAIETANTEFDGPYVSRHSGIAPGRYVALMVSDTGQGMDSEVRSRAFEPFFTTKASGKGTGLGLATVYGIVKQSGGEVQVYSKPGLGATFKVYLPRVEEEAEPLHEDVANAAASHGTETVLLVEDERLVRITVREALRRSGYSVLDAATADQAISLGEGHSGPIHLLLTDVVMPGTGGRQLAERLASSRPEMAVLFMSGYTWDTIVHHGVVRAEDGFIQKPFTPAVLSRAVRQVLDRAAVEGR